MPADVTTERFRWEDAGKATFDGQDLAVLANQHPTPFYLISEGQIRDNYRRFREAFSGVENLGVYYSIKSNFESVTLLTLAAEGCGAEISGALDLELVQRAGFDPERTVFDGPCKGEAELEQALRWGVHLVNIESLAEAKALSTIARRLGRKVTVGLRIDPLLKKPYYDKVISTYKAKFGFPIDQAVAACKAINEMPSLRVAGIMTHIGSQILRPGRYLETLDKLFELLGALRQEGIPIEELNLGGGYPAQSMRNYRLSRRIIVARVLERMNRIEARTATIAEFGSAMTERYDKLARATGLKPRLAVEPGRSIVSNACAVVGRVRVLKNDWLFTDISINDVPENLFFSEWRLVFPGQAPRAQGREVNIAGPTLATQDVLFFRRAVPPVTQGAPVAILDTGAYCLARANQFTRPRNAVYAVRADGSIDCVRRAETCQDVLTMQVWPEETATEARPRTSAPAQAQGGSR
jgi:diaminopimelate decarboxylase